MKTQKQVRESFWDKGDVELLEAAGVEEFPQ
jgi:hypothetical protein